MESLLSSKKQTKINVSLDDSIFYYPVRHHSVACSYHLSKIIEQYKPDCILIEGPENANDLIPILTHKNTIAPIALYYTYKDDKNLIDKDSDGVGTYQCYYPFLDNSPELLALRLAQDKNIKAAFIDLSYAEILISCTKDKGFLQKDKKVNYASDEKLSQDAFYKALCQKTNVRDFNEFWERYFEVNGLYQNSLDFIKKMHTYCSICRESSSKEELLEDGTIARESHMAKRIKEYAKDYKKILVIVGGFHVQGLLDATLEKKAPKINKKNENVYAIRYSIEATDAINGYKSGMPSAGFYGKIWDSLLTCDLDEAFDSVILNYIVQIGRKLRSKNENISTFDEICALRHARALAELRDKKAPSFFELSDAILSNFVKGEATLSNLEAMRILQDLTTGNKIGQLSDVALIPPIVQDFNNHCKIFRLKIDNSKEKEIALSIFSKETHKNISKFLYQCNFLKCDFAYKKQGPDMLKKTNRSLIREIWVYRFDTTIESSLIDASIYGSTLKEASSFLLEKNIKETTSAKDGAHLLMEGFLMGLGNISDKLASFMDALIISDGDFLSLTHAFISLNSLYEWQVLYNEKGLYDYKSLQHRAFNKILEILPSMYNVDKSLEQDVQHACLLLYRFTDNKDFEKERLELTRIFNLLIAHNDINPSLHGAILGLLYGLNTNYQEMIKYTITSYLLGTSAMVLKSADFLQGLFYTAKDLLLIDKEFLRQIDTLMQNLSDDDFIALLPDLRLAFSYFVPMETNRIAKEVASLHNTSRDSLLINGIDVHEYNKIESIDAWAFEHLDTLEERAYV